jgi:hypothetical protein
MSETTEDLIAVIRARADVADAFMRSQGLFPSVALQDTYDLLALVGPLTAQLATAKADAWDEGWGAANINRPTSRKGHWDSSSRKGYRTWIPDPLPVNPYRTKAAE